MAANNFLDATARPHGGGGGAAEVMENISYRLCFKSALNSIDFCSRLAPGHGRTLFPAGEGSYAIGERPNFSSPTQSRIVRICQNICIGDARGSYKERPVLRAEKGAIRDRPRQGGLDRGGGLG